MNDPEPRELALPLDSKWALLKPNLALERNDPLCASSWDVPWLLPGLRDTLSCPGRLVGGGFLLLPDPQSGPCVSTQSCLPMLLSVLPCCCQPPYMVSIQQGSCVFTDRPGLGKGQALCRGGRLPCLCHRGCRFPTLDLQALFPVTQHFVAGPGEDRCQGSQRQST